VKPNTVETRMKTWVFLNWLKKKEYRIVYCFSRTTLIHAMRAGHDEFVEESEAHI